MTDERRTDVPLTSHSPGDWVAVTSSEGWLLADMDPADPTVLTCWGLLRSREPLDAVLDALLSRGLRGVRGFALARRNDDGSASVVVRGAGWVTVDGADGQAHRISGADVSTWRETSAPAGWRALTLGGGAAPEGDGEQGGQGGYTASTPGVSLAGSLLVADPNAVRTEQAAPERAAPEQAASGRAPAPAAVGAPGSTRALDLSELEDEEALRESTSPPAEQPRAEQPGSGAGLGATALGAAGAAGAAGSPPARPVVGKRTRPEVSRATGTTVRRGPTTGPQPARGCTSRRDATSPSSRSSTPCAASTGT